ncbi:NUDIX hydrolase [Thermoactinomyces mirandus]|uniref:NUDIX hydrolase n=1 Tax=Thermoactinomyces mirandus TaxID=2756294 RepID=UPI001FECFE61|nr:8-oxo-dGTP diphosphatase [Thermoactinomyces mirandus]
MGQPFYEDLKYTICFIRSGDEILLLNREHPTWMGRWNGVGGKIRPGETPHESVLREVKEETGIFLEEAKFKGVVSWISDEVRTGGMYLYFAELPRDFRLSTPVKTEEGILDWKKISWILHPRNEGVTDSMPRYFPAMLNEAGYFDHRCVYQQGVLISFQSIPLGNV